MKIRKNDEWDYFDALGHNLLVRQLGRRLLICEPPYVIGVGGSWGAGKTSFLRKLWAYLGGAIEWEDGKKQELHRSYVEVVKRNYPASRRGVRELSAQPA